MGKVHLLSDTSSALEQEIRFLLNPVYGTEETKALLRWIREETGCYEYGTFADRRLSVQQMEKITYAVERLIDNTPVQYVFGHTLWKGLDLKVTADTLIPRPETAELADWVSEREQEQAYVKLLDAGTGSGCIAIALKTAHPNWQITGTDINTKALRVAEQNAKQNHTDIRWLKDDILHPAEIQKEQWDIVVSNPPYIPMHERETIPANVRNYEPQEALFVPDDNPLLFYQHLAALQCRRLYVEVHEQMSEPVADLFRQTGYKDVTIRKDIYNKPRMVYGRKD